MRIPGTWFLLAALGVVALFAAFACAPTAEPSPVAPKPQPTVAASSPTPAAPAPVRIGLLPIIDSVPFYAAEADGLFKEAGLDVKLVTFTSALERDAALQAGEIDGQLADLIATGLLNRDKARVTIVKTTYRGNSQKAMISLVVGKDSGIAKPEDLRGKEVAISQNSLIEYLLDRLLDGAGIPRDAVKRQQIAQIPLRAEMLAKGQIAAAVLPEPATTLAVQSGGRILLSDGQSRIGVSVLEFRNEFLAGSPETARRVVAAHVRAVQRINAEPSKYQGLLSTKANLPAILKDTFSVPPFPEREVPSLEDIKGAGEWMVQKGLLTKIPAYAETVDGRYLPPAR